LTLPKDVFYYRGLLSNLLAFYDCVFNGEKLQQVKKKKKKKGKKRKQKKGPVKKNCQKKRRMKKG